VQHTGRGRRLFAVRIRITVANEGRLYRTHLLALDFVQVLELQLGIGECTVLVVFIGTVARCFRWKRLRLGGVETKNFSLTPLNTLILDVLNICVSHPIRTGLCGLVLPTQDAHAHLALFAVQHPVLLSRVDILL
jgi:hypothetical protein